MPKYYKILDNKKENNLIYNINGKLSADTLKNYNIKTLNTKYTVNLKKNIYHKIKHGIQLNKREHAQYVKSVDEYFRINHNKLKFTFCDAENIMNFCFKNRSFTICDIEIPENIIINTTKIDNYNGCYYGMYSRQSTIVPVYDASEIIISNKRKITADVIKELCLEGASLTDHQLKNFVNIYVTETTYYEHDHYYDEFTTRLERDTIKINDITTYSDEEKAAILHLYAENGII
jgi:hypothetical protein